MIYSRFPFVLLCAAVMLPGCSSTETGEPVGHLDPAPVETIDLMAEPADPYGDIMFDEPALTPAPAPVNVGVGSSPAVASEIFSNGSVQVFSLENSPVSSASPVSSVPPSPVPASTLTPIGPAGTYAAPSVEVFSSEGTSKPFTGMNAPMAQMPEQPTVTGLTPPPTTASLMQKTKREEPAVIYFDHNSTHMDAEDQRIISGITGFHRSTAKNGQSSVALSVEGHASSRADINDPVKRKITNLKVSMDRAFVVARELIGNGVPAENVLVSAYGETQPPAAGSGEEAARRVEVYPEPIQ